MSVADFVRQIVGDGSTFKVVVSGALGGVVRWIALREGLWAGLGSVVIGAISAIYLGPLVTPIIATFLSVVIVDPVSQSTFAGFIVGLTGIVVIGFVLDMVRARRRTLTADTPPPPPAPAPKAPPYDPDSTN